MTKVLKIRGFPLAGLGHGTRLVRLVRRNRIVTEDRSSGIDLICSGMLDGNARTIPRHELTNFCTLSSSNLLIGSRLASRSGNLDFFRGKDDSTRKIFHEPESYYKYRKCCNNYFTSYRWGGISFQRRLSRALAHVSTC